MFNMFLYCRDEARVWTWGAKNEFKKINVNLNSCVLNINKEKDNTYIDIYLNWDRVEILFCIKKKNKYIYINKEKDKVIVS